MDFRLTPPPFPAESSEGYLMRLFDINGVGFTSAKLKAMGYSQGEIVRGESDAALRATTGHTQSDFAATTVKLISKTDISVGGEVLGRKDWTTHLRRWCPACLASDLANEDLKVRSAGWRYHRRFWWDFTCVRTCPIHSVRLESVCPTCNEDVTWVYGPLTTCDSGHSLLTCAAAPVAAEHARADAYIVGRIGGSPRVFAPVLDAWTLGDAIDAIEHLGIVALGGAEAWLSHIDPSRHPEMRSVGFDIAAGMPDTMNAMLDKLAERADLGSWGIDSVYRNLIWWARKYRDTLPGKAILDAILAHNAKRTVVRTYSEAAAFVDDSSPVSVSDISRVTGKSFETIAAYIRAMGHWPKKTARGTAILVPREVMRELCDLFEDSLPYTEVGPLLGLHKTQGTKLIQAGIVKRTPLHELVGKRNAAYSRRGIEAMLTQVAGDAPFVEVPADHLRPIAGSGHNIDGGVVMMLPMILNGEAKIECRLAGKVGLQGMMIDPAAFRRKRRHPKTREIAEGALNFAEAKAILGLGQNTLYAVAAAGLLERLEDKRRIIVTKESVERFKRAFITSEEIAAPLRTKPMHVIGVMHDLGRTPVISKKDDPRCKATIWRRRDVPKNMAALLRAKLHEVGVEN